MSYKNQSNFEDPKIDILAWLAFLMCVLGAVFYCYEYYLRVAPSVMQPELMQAFHIHEAGLGSLIAYYYLAYVPLQLPVGIMMDKFGPRRILTLACFLCAIGTYLFASTNLIMVAKIGRFLVGFGSAFAYVGVLKIADLWLPKKYFAMMAGICTALGMLGAISGEILMAKFVELTGWRHSLYSSAFIGFLLTFVLWCFIRDKSDQEVIRYGRSKKSKLGIFGELASVMSSKQLWINGFIGCLTFLPLTIFAEFWAVSFLESLGLTKDSAALGSALVFLGFGFGGPFWGRLSDVIKSRKRPLIVGSIVASVISYFVLMKITPDRIIYLYCMLFALGFFSSAQVLVFAIGNDICNPAMHATTMSFTNLLVMLGGFAFQPIVGEVVEHLQNARIQINDGFCALGDYRLALLIMPAGLFLATILSILLKETYSE